MFPITRADCSRYFEFLQRQKRRIRDSLRVFFLLVAGDQNGVDAVLPDCAHRTVMHQRAHRSIVLAIMEPDFLVIHKPVQQNSISSAPETDMVRMERATSRDVSFSRLISSRLLIRLLI